MSRFLMIAPAMPAMGGNGLAMRLGVFLEALSRAGATDLIVIPAAGDAAAPPLLPERLGVRTHVVPLAGRIDTHYALLSRVADARIRLQAFRAYGKPSLSAALSSAVLGDVRQFSGATTYDLVHVGRLYLAPAARACTASHRTIDIDDDDAAAYRARAAVLAAQKRNDAAEWPRAEASAFEALARTELPGFDTVFGAGGPMGTYCGPVAAIANAVSMPPAAPRCDDGRTVMFVGTLRYGPNRDGLEWLLRRVWPQVHRTIAPRLLIVGRDPPDTIRAHHGHDGVEVVGEVADLAPFYRRATLAIAPILSGGGTRIKLLEAAAFGVPFAATTMAASGLPLARPGCGWIADRGDDLAASIVAALRDPAERRRRAARARAAIRTHDRVRVVAALAQRFDALAAVTTMSPTTRGNAA